MKTIYEIPELEIVEFEVEDIITTSTDDGSQSGGLNGIYGGDDNEKGWSDFV